MLLPRTNANMGKEEQTVPFEQPLVQRESVRLIGGTAEPTLSAEQLQEALTPEDIEHFRPLLPMGSEVAADAYRKVAATITAESLSNHYTEGLSFFHQTFVPHLKKRLQALTGNAWDLSEYTAYAAGSDVDLMSHLTEAIAAKEQIALYPGDWYGFLVGSSHQSQFLWTRESQNKLACLCLPSVRNGQVTHGMKQFLEHADSCLLNINLFPTLEADERKEVARQLSSILPKSILSVSFSRGFGLTASQLGVFLVHKEHPYRDRFETQWNWFSYFFNAIAAKAFMNIDFDRLQQVDQQRRTWVEQWLRQKNFPHVATGSYYVKTFQINGALPSEYTSLIRDGRLRLCFKPPIV